MIISEGIYAMEKMVFGIVGYGFVGDAIKNGLEYFDYKQFRIYDPYKLPESNIQLIKDSDICFVCVPTPMGKQGCMDSSALEDVFEKLESIDYKGIVVVKSTVVPTVINNLISKYKALRIVTNPEFLTERRARQDFINTEYIIIGGKQKDYIKLRKLYKHIFPEAKIIMTSAEGAMFAKYMTNIFFATKISLMNEFYHLWQKMGFGDWKEVVEAFRVDTRVNPNHTQVPGPDGDFGFGGKCFGKDLNAINYLFIKHNIPNNVTIGAWEDNKIFRENQDWLEIEGAVTKEYLEDRNDIHESK